MKTTLLMVTLSAGVVGLPAFATTELDALRERCSDQERQIQRLEQQIRQLTGATEATATSAGTYTVGAGESLDSVARKSGCSVAALAQANGLKPSDPIQSGQKLKLPASAGTAATAPAQAPEPPVTDPAEPAAASTAKHRIQKGDTFASLSRKYRVSSAALIAANPGVKPTAMRLGQEIRLPQSAAQPAESPAPAPAAPAPAGDKASPKPAGAVPPAAPANDAATAGRVDEKAHYILIESQITYGEFAAKHGTTIERLNALNCLDLNQSTVLAKGSEICVPSQP